jgi:hypothetical protein
LYERFDVHEPDSGIKPEVFPVGQKSWAKALPIKGEKKTWDDIQSARILIEKNKFANPYKCRAGVGHKEAMLPLIRDGKSQLIDLYRRRDCRSPLMSWHALI